MVDELRRRAGRRRHGCAARSSRFLLAPGAGAERPARGAEVLRRHDDRGRVRRALRAGRRGAGARGRRLAAADDIFFITLPEARVARWPGRDLRARRRGAAGRVRARAGRRRTCRASCSPTGPSRRRRSAPAAGAIRGTPASAGVATGAGARDPRPDRRAPGAGRDPGRAIDRPWLDAALPDGRRAGDGDGRRDVARRGRRPRVRHPGRRRRARRDRRASRPASRSSSMAPPARSRSRRVSAGALLRGR